ncbi:DUF421 domain-containing protein [Bdellovibrio sp. ZAP7]|uniref:DUF421 domain-containing protein n=1 Tax=Bdellovibrio sp. ZAP7 TaxID=2231053 RepID=UPI001158F902|nr:YetF domain-containing protein [Bdellovibrio sp. ZAP7]QDK45674.1 DUF421 domain-containing protein [Bdellovibrio sp. ZAP7]
MWALQNPWWEYVVRAILVYAAVFVLLRFMGKKQIGELSPFDLVLLLIISESVSAAITGGDNSLTAGIICVSTFVIGNYCLDILGFKSKKVERLLEGEAQKIIENGVINLELCKEEYITLDEIASALREHGIKDIRKVDLAMLETNGRITVVKQPTAK